MNNTTLNFLNLDYIELMADGDHEMKETIIQMLLSEVPTEISNIEDAISSEDLKKLKAVSHKFKSTLSFVGYNDMIITNKEIEHIARTGENTHRLNSLLDKMKTYQSNIMPELKAALGLI